jgi:hypothetical protein
MTDFALDGQVLDRVIGGAGPFGLPGPLIATKPIGIHDLSARVPSLRTLHPSQWAEWAKQPFIQDVDANGGTRIRARTPNDPRPPVFRFPSTPDR